MAQILLIVLLNKITPSINDGEIVFGVFLDLSKAFVMVNHDILLKILHESGISGVVYDWFLVICLKCLSMCHS